MCWETHLYFLTSTRDGLDGRCCVDPRIARKKVSGQGVALGSKALALEHLAAGRLVRPFKLSLVTDFAYYVVCEKGRADEPDLLAFRRWLIAEAR